MDPPNKDINIKIYQNQQEVEISKDLREELEKIYKRKLEEQQIQKQNNVFKAEILCHKIQRLLPRNSSIPQNILRLIKKDVVFNQLTIFLDTCQRISRITSDWKVEEIDFNHNLFCELSIVHKELSETLLEYSKNHCDETDTLIKNLMEQAYMPSHIRILIHDAKKITKDAHFKFHFPFENELFQELKDSDKFEQFKTYIDECKFALKMKSDGKEEEEEFEVLVKKIKHNIYPLFNIYFRSNKNILRLAETLLKIVESKVPKGYFNFIWGK